MYILGGILVYNMWYILFLIGFCYCKNQVTFEVMTGKDTQFTFGRELLSGFTKTV